MSHHPVEALTVLPRGEGGSTRFGVAKIETNIVTSCCINLCSNQNIAVWGAFPRQGQKMFNMVDNKLVIESANIEQMAGSRGERQLQFSD